MTVQEIMDAVKELKVMELSELVKALEEEFGVSATPVAVAGVGGGAAERFAGRLQKARTGANARVRGAHGQFTQALCFHIHAQYNPNGRKTRA